LIPALREQDIRVVIPKNKRGVLGWGPRPVANLWEGIVGTQLQTGTPESVGMTGDIAPLLFHKRGDKGRGAFFHNSIISHFMVYEDRLETNLLLLCVHPKIQNGFL